MTVTDQELEDIERRIVEELLEDLTAEVEAREAVAQGRVLDCLIAVLDMGAIEPFSDAYAVLQGQYADVLRKAERRMRRYTHPPIGRLP